MTKEIMTDSRIVVHYKNDVYRTNKYVLITQITMQIFKYAYAASYTIEQPPFVCRSSHCNYRL